MKTDAERIPGIFISSSCQDLGLKSDLANLLMIISTTARYSSVIYTLVGNVLIRCKILGLPFIRFFSK